MANRSTNRTVIYLIAVVVIVVAFLLLGGGPWMSGMMHHGSRSSGMANWNWAQILISLTLGFLIGLLVSRRKWW